MLDKHELSINQGPDPCVCFGSQPGKTIRSQWKSKLSKNQDCLLGNVCKSWQSCLLIMVITSPNLQYFPVSCKSNSEDQKFGNQKTKKLAMQKTKKMAIQFVRLKIWKKSTSTSFKGHQFIRELLKNQKGSNYAGNWRMSAPCSAQQARRLDLLVSGQSHAPLERGQRRRAARIGVPKSWPPRCPWEMARAQLVLIWESAQPISNMSILFSSAGATSWFADISTKPLPVLARVGVLGPPRRRCPCKLAQAKITEPRERRRDWEADSECEHPARCSRHDPMIYGYLEEAPHFRARNGARGPAAGTAQMPLKNGPSQNCWAARDWEADFEGGPPPLISRINPFASQKSQQQLTVLSRGFVFPDRLVTLDRLIGPKSLLRVGMSSKIWISMERVLHEIYISITPRNSRGVPNSTYSLVCTIGSISDWKFRFPENTKLNTEEQQPNQFWKDTSIQKTFEDSKLSLS